MSEAQPQVHFSAPGYVLLATIRNDRCGTFRLICHSGAKIIQRGQLIRLTGSAIASLTFAYYSKVVAATGWQPCDQATPAAYLPMRYDMLDEFKAPEGVLLVEKEGKRNMSAIDIRAITDGHQRLFLEFTADKENAVQQAIAKLVHRAGSADALGCSTIIVSRLSAHTIHSAA